MKSERFDRSGYARVGYSRAALSLTGYVNTFEAACQCFRRSVATGTHWMTQYQFSHAFLARLGHDPHWPPWIREDSDSSRRE